MKIKCYTIDDNPSCNRMLKQYINDYPNLINLGSETDPEVGLEKLLSGKVDPDLLFLDIEFPNFSGIEILKQINGKTSVILISAHRHFGAEAIDHGAVGYLYKPFGFDKFESVVRRALAKRQTDTVIDTKPMPTTLRPFYFVPGNGREVRVLIKPEDILYIESASNFTIFHLISNQEHISSITLKQLETLLPSPFFLRINRSFIVNTCKIKRYDAYELELNNGKILPFGGKYKTEFLNATSLTTVEY